MGGGALHRLVREGIVMPYGEGFCGAIRVRHEFFFVFFFFHHLDPEG